MEKKLDRIYWLLQVIIVLVLGFSLLQIYLEKISTEKLAEFTLKLYESKREAK